jgi:hypothetical protein
MSYNVSSDTCIQYHCGISLTIDVDDFSANQGISRPFPIKPNDIKCWTARVKRSVTTFDNSLPIYNFIKQPWTLPLHQFSLATADRLLQDDDDNHITAAAAQNSLSYLNVYMYDYHTLPEIFGLNANHPVRTIDRMQYHTIFDY